jgi:tRNA threonylcarbamoyl adenosine modification protein YeaZ
MGVLVLGWDTSSAACVVALGRLTPDGNVDVLGTQSTGGSPTDARRHGESLAPAIDTVLREAGVSPRSLAALVCGLGPGPFTSLRVGVVTGVALGQSLGIPVYGECSLDAIALNEPGLVAAVGDARRREVYWAVYSDGRRTKGPEVGSAALVLASGATRAIGAGAVLYRDVLGELADSDGRQFPDPVALLRVAAPRILAAEPPVPLEPLYLRRPDAAPLATAAP